MKIAVFDDPDQSRQNYIETAAVVFAVSVYQVRRGISQYVAYHLIVAVAEYPAYELAVASAQCQRPMLLFQVIAQQRGGIYDLVYVDLGAGIRLTVLIAPPFVQGVYLLNPV